MGQGNWQPAVGFGHRPADDPTCCEVIYIDLLGLWQMEPTDPGDVGAALRVLYSLIEDHLPSFMHTKNGDRWISAGETLVGRGDYSIAWNDHTVICADCDGDWWHQGVGVVVNHLAHAEDYGELAELASLATAKSLFRFLAAQYPGRVSVRVDGYTSRPFDGTMQAAGCVPR